MTLGGSSFELRVSIAIYPRAPPDFAGKTFVSPACRLVSARMPNLFCAVRGLA